MIEGNVPTNGKVVKQETPAEITISMITEDLKNGINKAEMSIKYSIKPWEVDEMFKHPLLKGKRPARRRTLSFSFVDDVSTDAVKEIIEEVNPAQVTLEQAIDEVTETVTEVKEQMQETQEAITDVLGATEFDDFEDLGSEGDYHQPPTLEDTLELVEEQEMEIEDVEEDSSNTFNL
jgi:hypothetical protein